GGIEIYWSKGCVFSFLFCVDVVRFFCFLFRFVSVLFCLFCAVVVFVFFFLNGASSSTSSDTADSALVHFLSVLMPLRQYVLVHLYARFSAAEKQQQSTRNSCGSSSRTNSRTLSSS
ncbi:unnamed protein product, partial [Laminaria digitata]